jgi:sec-independent protein translocase protein TatC
VPEVAGEEAPESTAEQAPKLVAEEAPQVTAEQAPKVVAEQATQVTAEEAPHVKPGEAAQAEVAVMPLMEHLKELRIRITRAAIALAITTAISFIFAKQVLVILVEPMGDTQPLALKPTESIGNYMKVALICGVTLAMPALVYQLGRFIAPGLTKKEKRYLYLLVPGATISFVAGAAFAYFVMIPAAIPFLQGFLADIVEQQWAIGEYLSFVTSLLFWIGLSFELPLFIYFLAKTGLINAQMLSKNRKYAVVIIAILAAVITPTVDPLNMALVMGPLIVLYELGVILARIA